MPRPHSIFMGPGKYCQRVVSKKTQWFYIDMCSTYISMDNIWGSILYNVYFLFSVFQMYGICPIRLTIYPPKTTSATKVYPPTIHPSIHPSFVVLFSRPGTCASLGRTHKTHPQRDTQYAHTHKGQKDTHRRPRHRLHRKNNNNNSRLKTDPAHIIYGCLTNMRVICSNGNWYMYLPTYKRYDRYDDRRASVPASPRDRAVALLNGGGVDFIFFFASLLCPVWSYLGADRREIKVNYFNMQFVYIAVSFLFWGISRNWCHIQGQQTL